MNIKLSSIIAHQTIRGSTQFQFSNLNLYQFRKDLLTVDYVTDKLISSTSYIYQDDLIRIYFEGFYYESYTKILTIETIKRNSSAANLGNFNQFQIKFEAYNDNDLQVRIDMVKTGGNFSYLYQDDL